MPENITQFQVVTLEGGTQVVWVLTADGKLHFRNPQVGGGAWQEYTGN